MLSGNNIDTLFSGPAAKQKNVTQILEDMQSGYQLVISAYEKLMKAIDHAYANQSPPATATSEGEKYNIRPDDYTACVTAWNEMKEAFLASSKELGFYYHRYQLTTEEQLQLKEGYRAHGEHVLTMKDRAYSRLYGRLSGLTYVYEHPDPEDRRRIEYDNEGSQSKLIMFGFG